MDPDKVRRLFRQIVEGKIEPPEFEQVCSRLSQDELLLLRELAMNARCVTLTALAEKGFPNMTPRPN